MKKHILTAALATLLCLVNTQADAVLIDFNDLTAGQIVDTEYSFLGLTISAINPNRAHNAAIIFDSDNPTGGDTDLGFNWDGGNLQNTRLGKFLIIAEDVVDANNDFFVDDPDDEGRRPAGSITFKFDSPLELFSFDFIDVDNSGGEVPSNYSFDFKKNGNLLGSITLADLAALDGSIAHGNNFANRYPGISANQLGGTFDEVVANFAGSGAIDNVNFTYSVPEPTTMLLFGTGLAGAFLRRRRS